MQRRVNIIQASAVIQENRGHAEPSWRLFPLRVGLAYLFGTFAMFCLGPLIGDANNPFLLTIFIMATLVALALGYNLSRQHPCASPNKAAVSSITQRVLCVVTSAWVIAWNYKMYESTSLETIGLMDRILNPGEAYFTRRAIQGAYVEGVGKTSLLVQCLVLTAVLGWLQPVCMVFAWRNISTVERVFCVSAVLSNALVAWATGTNEQFGHIVVKLSCALMVLRTRRILGYEQATQKRKKPLALTVAIWSFGLMFGLFMGWNLLARLESARANEADVEASNLWFLDFLPHRVKTGISIIWFYASHGYCGLSYSLEMPFTWTMGLGSSRAFQMYASRYLGAPDLQPLTYPVRAEAEFGWPAYMYWSTMYPWLASDITFLGCLLLMALVGWLLFTTWDRSVCLKSPVECCFFTMLVTTILFVPVNAQVLVGRESLIACVQIIFLFLFWRFRSPQRATVSRTALSKVDSTGV